MKEIEKCYEEATVLTKRLMDDCIQSTLPEPSTVMELRRVIDKLHDLAVAASINDLPF